MAGSMRRSSRSRSGIPRKRSRRHSPPKLHHGAMGSLTGNLLVSNASLFDPNFRRTVVLIGHHDEEGAVGVVLNRPFDVTVDEAVPPLAGLVREGEALFRGGPVQPEAAAVVADSGAAPDAGVVPFESIGFLAGAGDRVELGAIRRAR